MASFFHTSAGSNPGSDERQLAVIGNASDHTAIRAGRIGRGRSYSKGCRSQPSTHPHQPLAFPHAPVLMTIKREVGQAQQSEIVLD